MVPVVVAGVGLDDAGCQRADRRQDRGSENQFPKLIHGHLARLIGGRSLLKCHAVTELEVVAFKPGRKRASGRIG